jgi:hypothetical protein
MADEGQKKVLHDIGEKILAALNFGRLSLAELV